jgi:hypothetical protein
MSISFGLNVTIGCFTKMDLSMKDPAIRISVIFGSKAVVSNCKKCSNLAIGSAAFFTVSDNGSILI